MSKWLEAEDYNVTETEVGFRTEDEDVRYVFERCEALCRENITLFGEIPVLKEGAKYNGIWLETQPMGGEMYACRDMRIALNNHLLFMKYQRRDGRIPGMITCTLPYMGITPHTDWIQGDFFTRSAFRMYYWIGKDENYLRLLYESLRDFDDYLWRYRDSDGDGCLETWCVWDTGDDNCTKLLYNRIHAVDDGLHVGEKPPKNHGNMPFASAEYMAYSYSHRMTLGKISDLLGNGEGDCWRRKAETVRARAIEYLWDDQRKAIYDRDRNGRVLDTLTLENLKCMYHGLFTQEMADDFIAEHLLNPREFWTELPLPNLAADDPLFYVNEKTHNLSPEALETVRAYRSHDMEDNSWSGPVGGLSVQRSIDALRNYGHHAEMSMIGRRWIRNLAAQKRFTQQYNPFTGEAAPGGEGYGPTLLSALEYITFLYGVDYESDRMTWSAGEGADSEFRQRLFGDEYEWILAGKEGIARKNGTELFRVPRGVRVETDPEGTILRVIGMEAHAAEGTVCYRGTRQQIRVKPNQFLCWKDGQFRTVRQVRFDGRAE